VPGECVLLTGRAGAGKETIGRGVVTDLRGRGCPAGLVDDHCVGAHLREGIESVTWLCRFLVDAGVVGIVTTPLPGRDARERLRAAVPELVEVFVDAPADVCATRAGRADPSYEEPYAPDLRVPTHDRAARASIAQVLSFLEERGLERS